MRLGSRLSISVCIMPTTHSLTGPIEWPLLRITTARPLASVRTASRPHNGGVTGSNSPDMSKAGTRDRTGAAKPAGVGGTFQTAHAAACCSKR
jgi:hypothetical protein